MKTSIENAGMTTLEKKIGQMLLLGFRGLKLAENDPIIADIRDRHIGGVILFDYDMTLKKPVRNVESVDQVRELNRFVQNFAETPLFVSVDQEGGQVARLKEEHGFPASLSAWVLGEKDDLGETRREAEQTAEILRDAGFNLNFAPDVDLRINPDNPIIAGKERSYGADPERVVRHAREVMKAHQERKIACTIKHFPGHGSSLTDTHLGFTDVTETWKEIELEPFKKLIESGDCWSVMTAHIFNSNFDPEFPATMSKNVIGGMLRDQLKFEGVVFSDDMEMGAISDRYGMEEALLRGIEAGVDVFTYANNVIYQPEIGERAISVITDFVKTGKVSEERIDQSYRRIRALKQKMGLI
ncbi:MAG TPA: glycoside hydrolase family 3 protein [Opitutales bacterium]|nr:glycoside hydrolase family 3 protein [Opitutales bacterium]